MPHLTTCKVQTAHPSNIYPNRPSHTPPPAHSAAHPQLGDRLVLLGAILGQFLKLRQWQGLSLGASSG